MSERFIASHRHRNITDGKVYLSYLRYGHLMNTIVCFRPTYYRANVALFDFMPITTVMVAVKPALIYLALALSVNQALAQGA